MRARFCPSAAAVVKRDEGLYSAAAAVVDTNGRMDSGGATRSCRIFCSMSTCKWNIQFLILQPAEVRLRNRSRREHSAIKFSSSSPLKTARPACLALAWRGVGGGALF